MSAGAVLQKFAEECLLCGDCVDSCALLAATGLVPAEIAQAVAGDQVGPELLAAIQRCDLCGACGRSCPADLIPAELFAAARQALVENGVISPLDYDVMLVNRNWHFFTIYRATYGIAYDDLMADRCDTLFFPGCTLASYAPELTRAAFGWLQAQGLRPGFFDLCCGKPLASIGLCAEDEIHLDRIRAQLSAAGAHQVITACPNCEAHLRAARMPGIQIRSLYALMVEAGVRLGGDEVLTFHDSCPDRCDGRNPRDIRALLSGFPQVEMPSRGRDTICCGSGGIVSTVDPDLCSTRAERRLAEFSASGAGACVTGCMACSHRLARAGEAGRIRHCLEVVFDIQVDYARVAHNTHRMWEGSQGEVNLERLAGAQAPPVEQAERGSHV
jgi:fumarate reductase (CoM/CoB) subunit B